MKGSYEKPAQKNARDDLMEILRVCWSQHEDLCSLEKPRVTGHSLDGFFFLDSFTSSTSVG